MQEQFKKGDALVVMQMSKEERLDLLIKLIPAYHKLSNLFDEILAENHFLRQENIKLKEQKGVGN